MGEKTAEQRAKSAIQSMRWPPVVTGYAEEPMVGNVTITKATEIIAEQIRENANVAYEERTRVLAMAAKMAVQLGYRVGIGRHPDEEPWENDWRMIVYIDLPMGQVSWHIHDSHVHLFSFLETYEREWDGHSADEKHKRMETFGKAEWVNR